MAHCNLSQADIAARVGKERTSVANTIRLLSLPKLVQNMVSEGRISAGHARTLLALPTDAAKISLAERVAREEMSVRQLERFVYAKSKHKNKISSSKRPAEIVTIEERFKSKLGTIIHVKPSVRGGKITIHYSSNEELQRIMDIVGIDTEL